MYATKVSDTNAYDASLAQLHPHMTNWLTSVEVPMWEMFLLRLRHLQQKLPSFEKLVQRHPYVVIGNVVRGLSIGDQRWAEAQAKHQMQINKQIHIQNTNRERNKLDKQVQNTKAQMWYLDLIIGD